MQRQLEPLLIDIRAAQMAVPESEIRAWAIEHSIFVSSLITELGAERQAVRDAIVSFGARPVMFEHDLGAQDVTAERAYIDGVMTSDIYVGVFADRYGTPLASRYSATESEYREAEHRGLRMALFVKSDADFDGRQFDFVGGMRNVYTTSPWSTSAELGERVKARFTQIASEEIAPWVRLGHLIFRARDVSSSGDQISVIADIRTPAVHAALQDMVEQRRGDVPFASPGVVTNVQVSAMRTQTQTTTVHRNTVELRITGRRDDMRWMTVNTGGKTWSADELAEAGLKDALFGGSNSPQQFGIPLQDPLEALRSSPVPESVLRPVAQLLVSEVLINSGMARTVDAFRLSPSDGQGRTLKVTWTPPQRAINLPAEAPRSVEGFVRGL